MNKSPRFFFGLQEKFFVFFSVVALFLFVVVMIELYGLGRIERLSDSITKEEVPMNIAINDALITLLSGRDAFSRILEVETVDDQSFVSLEAALSRAFIRFDVLLAAITWGSETEAFRQSDGGLNYLEWQRLDSDSALRILPPSDEERVFAATADIYFSGFAKHSLQAVAAHKKSLRLEAEGNTPDALRAARESAEFQKKATRFLHLTIRDLSQTVRLSNTAITARAADIEFSVARVFRNIIIFFSFGIAIVLIASYLFVRYTMIVPIKSLTSVATKISQGDLAPRSRMTRRDEVGVLSYAFNNMTDRLAEYPSRLRAEVGRKTRALGRANERLKMLLAEQEMSAKMLVRRDIDLAAANESLRGLDRAKSEFVSIAAHQMRTPLSATKWAFQIILDGDLGPLTDGQKEMLTKGIQSNEHMIRLINDLLSADRLEVGKLQYEFKPIFIDRLIGGLVNELRSEAAEKDIVLNHEKNDANLPRVLADEEKLRAVAQNLIDNAIHYTPARGRIVVRTALSGREVSVSVSDTGIGISPEEQPQLFKKFFRSHNAVRVQPNGSGLGLFISQQIIKAHNGRLTYAPRKPKGSIFTFTLPALLPNSPH